MDTSSSSSTTMTTNTIAAAVVVLVTVAVEKNHKKPRRQNGLKEWSKLPQYSISKHRGWLIVFIGRMKLSLNEVYKVHFKFKHL